MRTIVISRKLVTESEYDVQFSDLQKEYAFGVAAFRQRPVRHADVPGVLKLKFEYSFPRQPAGLEPRRLTGSLQINHFAGRNDSIEFPVG